MGLGRYSYCEFTLKQRQLDEIFELLRRFSRVVALRPIQAVRTTSLVRHFLPLVQEAILRSANRKFSPKAAVPVTTTKQSFQLRAKTFRAGHTSVRFGLRSSKLETNFINSIPRRGGRPHDASPGRNHVLKTQSQEPQFPHHLRVSNFRLRAEDDHSDSYLSKLAFVMKFLEAVRPMYFSKNLFYGLRGN